MGFSFSSVPGTFNGQPVRALPGGFVDLVGSGFVWNPMARLLRFLPGSCGFLLVLFVFPKWQKQDQIRLR